MSRFQKLIYLFFAIVLSPANAQIDAGTVIALGNGRKQAVFAADSRAVIFMPNAQNKINDDYCKLATARGMFIAATYGTDGLVDDSLTLHAKNIAEAVIDSVDTLNEVAIDEIVDRWKSYARNLVANIATSEIERLQAAQGGTNNLLGGVFALRLRDSNIAYRQIDFKLHARGNGAYSINPVLSPITVPSRDVDFSVFGATDIFAQFFLEKKPPFILQELKRWDAAKTRADYVEYRVRRLVELTMKHTARQATVGGHINSVELDANGIKWLTDNPECTGR
jgi:hypothetical protein